MIKNAKEALELSNKFFKHTKNTPGDILYRIGAMAALGYRNTEYYDLNPDAIERLRELGFDVKCGSHVFVVSWANANKEVKND